MISMLPLDERVAALLFRTAVDSAVDKIRGVELKVAAKAGLLLYSSMPIYR